jgi:SAM-dependent methyltransferase
LSDTDLTSKTGATAPESPTGQQGLEDHYSAWFEQIEKDFRGASLNQYIGSLVAPGRVLDMGCGSGGMSAELLRRGCDVVSQDVSEAMVTMCRRYLGREGLPSENVRLGGVDDIRETAVFDTVVSLDVIEHIEDDRRAMAIMRRAIKDTGRLILSVPALSRLYGPKDEQIGHYRRYDKAQLVELIEQSGFTIDAVRYWNLIGVLPVWLSVVRRKRLDESMRYEGRSAAQRALNAALRLWFTEVENRIAMPVGLTLIVEAHPK